MARIRFGRRRKDSGTKHHFNHDENPTDPRRRSISPRIRALDSNGPLYSAAANLQSTGSRRHRPIQKSDDRRQRPDSNCGRYFRSLITRRDQQISASVTSYNRTRRTNALQERNSDGHSRVFALNGAIHHIAVSKIVEHCSTRFYLENWQSATPNIIPKLCCEIF